jgi:hypothetical protein
MEPPPCLRPDLYFFRVDDFFFGVDDLPSPFGGVAFVTLPFGTLPFTSIRAITRLSWSF